jgi:hypothetical protein
MMHASNLWRYGTASSTSRSRPVMFGRSTPGSRSVARAERAPRVSNWRS